MTNCAGSKVCKRPPVVNVSHLAWLAPSCVSHVGVVVDRRMAQFAGAELKVTKR